MKPKNTILCVDDEPINLAILTYILRKDHKVYTSTSATDALKLMEKITDIDHVISDFHMPGMNGIEFIKLAKKNYPKIIFHILTGFHKNQDVLSALKNKLIENYLEKPFNKEDIFKALS